MLHGLERTLRDASIASLTCVGLQLLRSPERCGCRSLTRAPNPEPRDPTDSYNDDPAPPWTFLSKLNPEQREAVLHLDGPLLILAGAGSGKTRVITYRIAYLIGDGHAEPDNVLAVTFTNKAAGEMRERVEALIGADSKGVWLSTFHALCARLLRREAPKIGLSRDFVIYDSSDQVALVKQIEKELGIDDKFVPPRQALSRISHLRNRMEGPDTLRGTYNIRDEQIAKIFERYVTSLRDSNALDFDDLLLKTVELFETSEQAREFYARKFRYVMIDEYQDTNRPQYMLIRRLAEIHRNLAVVGDPDQSIYKWRGADLRNILDFEPTSPKPRPSGSSRTTAPRRSSSTPPAPSSARTATARTSGCGRIARAARASSPIAATTSSRKPTSSCARSSRRAPRASTARSPCSTASTRSRGRLKTR